MLVLSRKRNESVYLLLPGVLKVRLRVESFFGDKVRLSFDAPPEVVILRCPELCNEDGTPKPKKEIA
jgi:sRNA-binding carbon storage regulator CsrA